MTRFKTLLPALGILLGTALASLPRPALADAPDKLPELRLDWATYNVPSIILKQKGWLESALLKDGTKVVWLQSTGSNTADQFLASGSVDFNSTAASAALLARTNGIRLKTVYIYARPEWEQFIVKDSSPIRSLADLRGKKISATRGTDAFFFLLHSLVHAGLSLDDIQELNLNQPDGYTAWKRGDADAWVALDPFLAEAKLHDHARVIYRNINYLSLGTLNVSDGFLAAHPDTVRLVLRQYERARKYVLAHPEESAQALAQVSHTNLDVARQVLSRIDHRHHTGVPDAYLRRNLTALEPFLIQQKLVRDGADPAKALDELIDTEPAREALGRR